MLVETIIVGLVGTAVYKVSTNKKGIMTNERRAIYDAAMKRDPPLPADQLITLAGAYDNEGLPSYADSLRKRANLLNLPPAIKQQRRDALQKFLACQDSALCRVAANAFEAEGAFGSAKTLRDYADGLDAAAFQASIAPPAPPPAPVVSTPDPSVNGAPLSTPISGTVSGGVGGVTQASSPEASTPSTAEQSAGLAGTSVPLANPPEPVPTV